MISNFLFYTNIYLQQTNTELDSIYDIHLCNPPLDLILCIGIIHCGEVFKTGNTMGSMVIQLQTVGLISTFTFLY